MAGNWPKPSFIVTKLFHPNLKERSVGKPSSTIVRRKQSPSDIKMPSNPATAAGDISNVPMNCKNVKSNGLAKKLEAFTVRTWLLLSQLFRLSKRPTRARTNRILVAKSCCFGDAILSLYALRAFKNKNPDKSIHVLCSHRIAFIYDSAPFIDKIHTLPVTGKNLVAECLHPRFMFRLIQMILALRSLRFGLLLDFELYHGYPVILKSLLSIPSAHGFEVPGTYPKKHDRSVFREKTTPEWQCYYHLVDCPLPHAAPAPLYPSNQGVKQTQVGVVFGSSFNWPQKKWPLSYFKTVIHRLTQKGYRITLFGVASEYPESEVLEAVAPGQIKNTVGKLAYIALIKELQSCRLVFGNDTGTMHLAAACDIPVVTLFGPTQASKWNALTSKPVTIEIPCRPCYYLSTMPDCPHRNCLNQLKPEQLLSSLYAELEPTS